MLRFLVCLCCLSFCCFADCTGINAGSYPYDDDGFLQGYLQANLDVKYKNSGVIVNVRHGEVVLENLPEDEALANQVIKTIKDVSLNGRIGNITVMRGAKCEAKQSSDKDLQSDKKEVSGDKKKKERGIWLPGSLLFPVNIADPRQAMLSGSIRFFNREICNGPGLTTSLADTLPIYRWFDVGSYGGELQLDIEAGVWALFDTGRGQKLADLVNTDFRVAIPLTYAFDKWAFRLRAYHLSAHLGDEYMIDEKIDVASDRRKNLSREAVDFFVSYQISPEFRVYGGLGGFVHSDKSFFTKPFYIEYGAEAHIVNWKWCYQQLNIAPFIAIHLRNWQDFKWRFDSTCALGLEWSRFHRLARKVRTYIEFHNGYSVDGQFSRLRETYAALKLSYGY